MPGGDLLVSGRASASVRCGAVRCGWASAEVASPGLTFMRRASPPRVVQVSRSPSPARAGGSGLGGGWRGGVGVGGEAENPGWARVGFFFATAGCGVRSSAGSVPRSCLREGLGLPIRENCQFAFGLRAQCLPHLLNFHFFTCRKIIPEAMQDCQTRGSTGEGLGVHWHMGVSFLGDPQKINCPPCFLLKPHERGS